jgi:hypothetical protein
MSTKARTIDNLGVDISIQYARNMEQLDKKLLEESRAVPLQNYEVMATTPYIFSEWDELFNTRRRNQTWAQFFAPPSYASHRRNIFSFQLIPSMGTPEKHEAEMERLKHFHFGSKKKKRKKISDEMDEKEEKEEEKERDILLKLLEQIAFLDKQIHFVNARRGQYQKG